MTTSESNGRFFYKTNRIDSNRELECSSIGWMHPVIGSTDFPGAAKILLRILTLNGVNFFLNFVGSIGTLQSPLLPSSFSSSFLSPPYPLSLPIMPQKRSGPDPWTRWKLTLRLTLLQFAIANPCVRPCDRPSVRHTRDPRQNGSSLMSTSDFQLHHTQRRRLKNSRVPNCRGRKLLRATILEKWILPFNIYGNWAGEGGNVLGFQFRKGKMSVGNCSGNMSRGICPAPVSSDVHPEQMQVSK